MVRLFPAALAVALLFAFGFVSPGRSADEKKADAAAADSESKPRPVKFDTIQQWPEQGP